MRILLVASVAVIAFASTSAAFAQNEFRPRIQRVQAGGDRGQFQQNNFRLRQTAPAPDRIRRSRPAGAGNDQATFRPLAPVQPAQPRLQRLRPVDVGGGGGAVRPTLRPLAPVSPVADRGNGPIRIQSRPVAPRPDRPTLQAIPPAQVADGGGQPRLRPINPAGNEARQGGPSRQIVPVAADPEAPTPQIAAAPIPVGTPIPPATQDFKDSPKQVATEQQAAPATDVTGGVAADTPAAADPKAEAPVAAAEQPAATEQAPAPVEAAPVVKVKPVKKQRRVVRYYEDDYGYEAEVSYAPRRSYGYDGGYGGGYGGGGCE